MVIIYNNTTQPRLSNVLPQNLKTKVASDFNTTKREISKNGRVMKLFSSVLSFFHDRVFFFDQPKNFVSSILHLFWINLFWITF